MQSTLKLAGYWTGPVDGEWTPELTTALTAFQTALGVAPTGVVDAATLSALQQTIAEAQTAATSTTTTVDDDLAARQHDDRHDDDDRKHHHDHAVGGRGVPEAHPLVRRPPRSGVGPGRPGAQVVTVHDPRWKPRREPCNGSRPVGA